MRQGPSACAVFHPCESHVDLTRRAAIHRRSALARHITLDASTRVAVAAQKAACSICSCMWRRRVVVELTPTVGAVQSSERGQLWLKGCTEPSPPSASTE